MKDEAHIAEYERRMAKDRARPCIGQCGKCRGDFASTSSFNTHQRRCIAKRGEDEFSEVPDLVTDYGTPMGEAVEANTLDSPPTRQEQYKHCVGNQEILENKFIPRTHAPLTGMETCVRKQPLKLPPASKKMFGPGS